MKVTNEQFEQAMRTYATHRVGHLADLRAAIESLPEPLPRLRPLAEMPAEVPEGAVRLYGRLFLGEWLVDQQQCPSHRDTHGADVLPPLPESPKPSLQDELVTALELCRNVINGSNEGYAVTKKQTDAAFLAAQTALTKVKGAPQR